jgi:nitrite reductase/ring-hydroxylating ferredoxin subunit
MQSFACFRRVCKSDISRTSSAAIRKGFAITIQENPGTTRRQVISLFIWTTLVGLAAALWAFLRGRPKTYPARVVAQAADIPVGGSKIFTYPTDIEPCILLRPASDTFVAFSRTCTHASCNVFYHPEDNVLACPCHQGAFSAANGSVIAGPPPRPLPRVLLERRGQDLVATGLVKT